MQEPERFVARRPSLSGPGWEVLVKWRKLGYEHTTWEVGAGSLPLHAVHLQCFARTAGLQPRSLADLGCLSVAAWLTLAQAAAVDCFPLKLIKQCSFMSACVSAAAPCSR